MNDHSTACKSMGCPSWLNKETVSADIVGVTLVYTFVFVTEEAALCMTIDPCAADS